MVIMKIRRCFLLIARGTKSFWIFIWFFSLSMTVLSQNTYTVNSTDDTEDLDLADNICADSKGNCTLRAAIQNANKFSVKDKIDFKIKGTGPFIIHLKKNLPPIKETVELNATEVYCYSNEIPQIILDGTGIKRYDITEMSDLLNSSQGLQLTGESSGSTIKGFAIYGFIYYGIGVFTNKNIIQGNIIGSSAEGRNGFLTRYGITIRGSDNLIGGCDKKDKNAIFGTGAGVFISTSNTRIIGNYIGTTADGCSSVPNRVGIALTRYSEYNLISDNLISGNDEGVHLSGDDNTIINNRIGTNAAGTEKIPNGVGIVLSGAVSNSIGKKNKGNLISGNKVGIVIEDKRVPIDQKNRILNNFIGTDITGNFDLGNDTGILIKSGKETWIGGFEKDDGNTISGNTNFGIELTGAQETIITGNYIGTNKRGTKAIPNGGGIKLEGDPEDINNFNNSIIANLISGNSGNGIEINNAEYNSITGNLLGTQKNGISSLPNGGNGIKTGYLAQNNCIGGPGSDKGNTIAYNRDHGISMMSEGSREGEFLNNNFPNNQIFANGKTDIFLGGEKWKAVLGPKSLNSFVPPQVPEAVGKK